MIMMTWLFWKETERQNENLVDETQPISNNICRAMKTKLTAS